MSRRRRRRSGWWQSRRLPTILLGIILLSAVVLDAWQSHRFDELCERRYRLEVRAAELARAREAAELRWCRSTSRAVVVQRAQRELGMVESQPDQRQLLALPGRHVEGSEPLGLRLARGLDRFANIRAAWAEEEP